MSFLKPGAGMASAAAPTFNSADVGLGHLFGADPTRISSIANGIGNAANGIATAGGAAPAYAQQQQAPQANNYMQLSDPDMLRAILSKFNPAQMQRPGVYQ